MNDSGTGSFGNVLRIDFISLGTYNVFHMSYHTIIICLGTQSNIPSCICSCISWYDIFAYARAAVNACSSGNTEEARSLLLPAASSGDVVVQADAVLGAGAPA